MARDARAGAAITPSANQQYLSALNFN